MTNDETDRAAAVAGVTSPPQAADIRDRWWWVEHSVWTDRMLTRLEQSGPTTKTAGLRRRGCLVWNTAPVPMVSLTETPLTGEPDAGNPPVRFGGRGGANPAIPTSIELLRFVVPPLGGAKRATGSARLEHRLKPALRTAAVCSPAFRWRKTSCWVRAVGTQAKACTTNCCGLSSRLLGGAKRAAGSARLEHRLKPALQAGAVCITG